MKTRVVYFFFCLNLNRTRGESSRTDDNSIRMRFSVDNKYYIRFVCEHGCFNSNKIKKFTRSTLYVFKFRKHYTTEGVDHVERSAKKMWRISWKPCKLVSWYVAEISNSIAFQDVTRRQKKKTIKHSNFQTRLQHGFRNS